MLLTTHLDVYYPPKLADCTAYAMRWLSWRIDDIPGFVYAPVEFYRNTITYLGKVYYRHLRGDVTWVEWNGALSDIAKLINSSFTLMGGYSNTTKEHVYAYIQDHSHLV